MLRLLYRTTGIVAIVAFWAVMWALLLRSELWPESSTLQSVPFHLVAHQLFEHEQTSELFIHADGKTLGHVRLLPKMRPEGPLLRCSGNAQMDLPGATGQVRSSWEAELSFDPTLNLLHLEGSFTSRAPTSPHPEPFRTEFTLDPAANRGWYRFASAGQILAEQSFTLDQAGLSAVLNRWGLGPDVTRQVAAFAPSAGALPELTARQGRFTTHGEQMETYLITLKAGGQTWLEGHLTQLGQILEVKTLWGWQFETE